MIHSILIAMSLAAAPAAADPREAPAPSPAPTAQAPKLDAKRYCIVDTITGSRLPRRVCHSRAEWLDLGTDPLAKD